MGFIGTLQKSRFWVLKVYPKPSNPKPKTPKLPQQRGLSQDGASACQDLGRRPPALPERNTNRGYWGVGLGVLKGLGLEKSGVSKW